MDAQVSLVRKNLVRNLHEPDYVLASSRIRSEFCSGGCLKHLPLSTVIFQGVPRSHRHRPRAWPENGSVKLTQCLVKFVPRHRDFADRESMLLSYFSGMVFWCLSLIFRRHVITKCQNGQPYWRCVVLLWSPTPADGPPLRVLCPIVREDLKGALTKTALALVRARYPPVGFDLAVYCGLRRMSLAGEGKRGTPPRAMACRHSRCWGCARRRRGHWNKATAARLRWPTSPQFDPPCCLGRQGCLSRRRSKCRS